MVTICTTSFNFHELYVLPTQCIHVWCVDLRTNNYYFSLQHEFIGFYNRGRECLQRGRDWVFKSEGYSFVLKRLNSNLERSAADTGHAQQCLTSKRSKPADFQYQISGVQEKECLSQTPYVGHRTYVQLYSRICADKPTCKQKWIKIHNNGSDDMRDRDAAVRSLGKKTNECGKSAEALR